MNTPKLGYLEITPKPGADLLHTITDIIQRAIDRGEHANPADFAREVLAAVEEHYESKREGLFKERRGLTRLARWG